MTSQDDTGQTAPAPASGDVVVPRKLAEWLLARLRYHGEGREGTQLETLAQVLASAPRPSGDVAAKLGEHTLIEGEEHFGCSWCGADGAALESPCHVPTDAERIATLEQERTARDAECERLRAGLTKIARRRVDGTTKPDTSDFHAYEMQRIARRALGDQG